MEKEEIAALVKRLVCGKETLCPYCRGAVLAPLHPRRKYDRCRFRCPACGQVIRVAQLLKTMPE